MSSGTSADADVTSPTVETAAATPPRRSVPQRARGTVIIASGVLDASNACDPSEPDPVLVAQLRAADQAPVQVILCADGDRFVIGRDDASCDECGLVIGDSLVSRVHAAIVAREGLVLLEDLHATNGTFLNGERVEGTATIRSGDRIRLGHTEIDFVVM